MHLVSDAAGTPISSVDELRQYFAGAGKPRAQWRVGTEHEMCGVYRADASAPGYGGERGIEAILSRIARAGWTPVVEGGNTIALVRGDAQVTIEPGGQLEHAARPVFATSELALDMEEYVSMVCEPSKTFDIAWLAVGFRPFGTREDVPWMPKQRYEVMRDYLPAHGRLALDMMKRTATVQVNLDYADSDDAKSKLRAIMCTTPILTALYANSPIVSGADSGYQSYRAEVWRYTDPARCGLLPFVFEDGDVFERYVEWALDVPMFFVYRGQYRPVQNLTFRRFMAEGFEGSPATFDDWTLHLSTLFPEARLKKYIEVRGCDASTLPMTLALGPLCRGILYSQSAMDAATALTLDWSWEQRLELGSEVPRLGLRTPVPGRSGVTLGDLAKELVAIAKEGLADSPEELPFLEPVAEVADSGRTRSDEVREIWNRHQGDPRAVIAALSYAELQRC